MDNLQAQSANDQIVTNTDKVVLRAEELAFGKQSVKEDVLQAAKDETLRLEIQLNSIVDEVAKHGESVIFENVEAQIKFLQNCRNKFDHHEETEFKKFFQKLILPHTQESEFCNYAYTKPRGYAGDFGAMELIWKGRTDPQNWRYRGSSEKGKLINAMTLDMANCRANEYRANYLRNLITKHNSFRIASVGAGSGIELTNISPIFFNDVDSIDLFDQDIGALELAKSRLSFLNKKMTAIPANITKSILKMKPDTYTFIYSSGLFDYFDQNSAQKLSQRLWTAVAPGGTICLTNAHAKNPTKLWMEYVGDWRLIYRNMHEILGIFEDFEDIASVKIEKDGFSVYQYISVHKKSA